MKHFEIYKKDPATGALYPEGQRRKKGLARILEIVVRDFWQLLGSGLIATAAALPYGLCIMLFLPSNALGPLILSCVVTGALASVFGMSCWIPFCAVCGMRPVFGLSNTKSL